MLKKIGLVAFLLLLGGGGWLANTWQQVTQLPDWYSRDSTAAEPKPSVLRSAQVDDPSEVDNLAFKLQKKVDRVLMANPSGRQQIPTVKLTAQEFNQFVVTSLPTEARSPEVISSVKAINTEIRDSRIKSGVILDTATLPLDQLPPDYRLAVTSLLQSFPALRDKEIYIGMEGQPRLQQRKIVFGENARLVVGNLRFSYGDISDRINIPPEVIEQMVNLQLGRLQVEDLDFKDRSAILKGKVK